MTRMGDWRGALRVLVWRPQRPKSDEVTGDWRKLHNEEFDDLYCPSIVIRVFKSRRMRWVGHVACMEERCMQGFGEEP